MMGLEIDPSFIQKAENQPKSNITEAGGIPLIDLSPLRSNKNGPNNVLETLVSEVESACSNWGFFQVTNHSVPVKRLERVQSAAKEFFALPIDEKRRVGRDEGNFLGYYDTEHTKNVRDRKEVFDFAANDPTMVPIWGEPGETRMQEIWNRWPEYPPHMRDACMEYSKAVEDLSYKLLQLIATTLKLPSNHLNSYFEDSISRIRLNHYPPCPSSNLALGVGPHKDQGALTVLAQDQVGGLDIRRKSDGMANGSVSSQLRTPTLSTLDISFRFGAMIRM